MKAANRSLIALALLPTIAAASYDGFTESVHFYTPFFYGGDNAIDFGRAPQRYMNRLDTREPLRAGTDVGPYYASWRKLDEDERRQPYDLVRARNFEKRGLYQRALRAFRLSNASPSFVQERTELFKALRFHTAAGLQTYLRDRYLIKFGNKTQALRATASLRSLKPALALKPYAAYALASTEPDDPGPDLAHRYLDVYKAFPKSPRGEAALIMSIRSLVSQRKGDKPTQADVAEAKELLSKFLAHYPNSRFRHNALGWLGRCEWLSNNVGAAVNLYVRQTSKSFANSQRWQGYESLARVCAETNRTDRQIVQVLRQRLIVTDGPHFERSGDQLRDCFASLNIDEAAQVQKAIRQDPELLEAYITYRIEDTNLSLPQERNLLKFAISSLQRMPNAPAPLLARVAQLNYNNSQYRAAKAFAQAAIRRSGKGEPQQRAIYILAGAEAHLGKHDEAIALYNRLLRQHPSKYLAQSAQECLAVQHERYGDPLVAMDIYRRLKYEYDVDYLSDIRLTPAQLRRYIRTLPSGETKNVLTYTLGMRYLRTERFDEARRAFKFLPKVIRTNWGLTVAERKKLEGEDHQLGYDRAPKVQDPVLIVDTLQTLTNRANHGRTAEIRAQALYQKAAYIYKGRNLLFYSPGLWEGERAFAFQFYWNPAASDKADSEAVARHFHEHDCARRCVLICEEILRKYPHSSVIPKTLYTDAIAAYHDVDKDPRSHEKDRTLEIAIHRLERLQREYPKHPLARVAFKYAYEFKGQLRNAY